MFLKNLILVLGKEVTICQMLNQEDSEVKKKPTRMERLVYLGLAKEVLTINEAAFFAGINSWKLREQMQLMV